MSFLLYLSVLLYVALNLLPIKDLTYTFMSYFYSAINLKQIMIAQQDRGRMTFNQSEFKKHFAHHNDIHGVLS